MVLSMGLHSPHPAGLDAAPPEFAAADRLRGPEGAYVGHIESATGCGAKVRRAA